MDNALAHFWSDGWVTSLCMGAFVTVIVALISMSLGWVLGVCMALIMKKKILVFSTLVEIVMLIIRGIPEILIIYYFFFGFFPFFDSIFDSFNLKEFSNAFFPLFVAILSIGIISASYTSEVTRGALQEIPEGQIDAAHSLGLSKMRIVCSIIIPQMVQLSLPGLNNVWQNTLKDTSLLSVIGLSELLRKAIIGASSTSNSFLFYAFAAFLYLVISGISQIGFGYLKNHWLWEIK